MATSSLAYGVSALQEGLAFGATVSGLTRDHLRDDAVRQSLRDLWIDKGVLLFRGEDTQEMHVELSKVYGALEPHPFPESNESEFPELVRIKYFPEDGSRYRVKGELRGGWLPWHSDLIYTSRINHGGILRPVQLPESGGMTGFIDQIAAYDRLPQSLKDQIEGLNVVYAVEMNMARMPFIAERDEIALDRMAKSGNSIARRSFTYPRVTHPMVYVQKETGRKVLNVSPGFAVGIYEMGGPDGDALLEEVISYYYEPSGMYFHAWQMGDMVLWDNWRTLHCATGVPAKQTRMMQRTTITGDYALGKALDGGAVPDFDV